MVNTIEAGSRFGNLKETSVADFFRPYLRSGVNPPLDAGRLALVPSSDASRSFEGIHAGGDVSFYIYYKEIAAQILSLKVDRNDLWIVQMQGTKHKVKGSNLGYRVFSGMDVPCFFADVTRQVLTQNGFDRVILPAVVQGINEDQLLVEARKEGTQDKYTRLREILGMQFDPALNSFVFKKP